MNGTEIISFLSDNFPTVMSTVGAVAGSLFTAIFLRHDTATTEFEKIKAGQFREVADELLKSGKMTYTEYFKANNFLKVAKIADEIYAEMPHPIEEKVNNFDWFLRFYEAVGNISNEEMQELWAKILAGEINNLSSISLRTIDVLKNMSQRDAQLFEKICSHSFKINNEYFLPNYDSYINRCNISYGDIMKLSEQGLIHNGALMSKTNSRPYLKIACINNGLLMTQKAKDNTTNSFNIQHYKFTLVGNEIASLNDITVSDEDFIAFGNEIKKSNKAEVGIHKIVTIEDNNVSFDDLNLLDSDIQP